MNIDYSRKFLFLLFVMCLLNAVIPNPTYSLVNEEEQGAKPKVAANANINAWIIVAGDRESDHSLYYCIENGCDEVYDILLGLGYPTSSIYYLAEDWDGSLPSRATATSEKVNIQSAIETWAADKVSSTYGLGIFLFDHGGTGSMSLPGSNLRDYQLDDYLNTLEAATGMTRSVIVYEACHSGSFIDPVSKSNRIVVCATDSAHSSYPTADLTTAVFTEAFWSSISVGYSIGEAFENAKANVDAAGLGDYQKPWIDDNHDELGHTVDPWGQLPYWGDGYDALDVYINQPLIIKPWLTIEMCPIRQYITPELRTLPISIQIKNNDSALKYVRAIVTPPDWTPPIPRVNPDDPYDPEIPYFPEDVFSDSFFDVFFTLSESASGTHTYTASLSIPGLIKQFGDNEGDFGIRFAAKTESGVVAPMVPSVITINEEGEAPVDTIPPTISLSSPSSNNELSGMINITATGDDDQALDKIQILLDGVLLKDNEMPLFYPYPETLCSLDTGNYTDGIYNITAIAIDDSGNRAQQTVFVRFHNETPAPFDYQPYLIGAGIGVGVSLFGSLIFKRKKK